MGVERLRRTRVAGYYYPRDAEALRDDLRSLTQQAGGTRTGTSPCVGVIVPHAGYHLSGMIVGATLGQITIPRRCIILTPNHDGWGAPWSIMERGAYQTPLGDVPIDEELAHALRQACPMIIEDQLAQQAEHGIEVQLPFLQWLGPPDLCVVPVVVNSRSPQEWREVGAALAGVVRMADEPVLVLASAELSRYESREVIASKDRRLIEAIQRLDAEELIRRVGELGVTLCGCGVVACLIEAARGLGATTGRLVQYATSADVEGDEHSAVGYAGITLS